MREDVMNAQMALLEAETAPWRVAALYVDPRGPYRRLTNHWYDADHNARSYAGNLPVVAHPPCGPWGKLAWRCTNQDRSTAHHALAQVRRCGGVLEHPIGSQFFKEVGIATAPWTPDRELDEFGGYTIRVSQYDWGHRAEKDTIVYICGGDGYLPPLLRQVNGPDHHPVQRMGKIERRLTPYPFAWWLCATAARCAKLS